MKIVFPVLFLLFSSPVIFALPLGNPSEASLLEKGTFFNREGFKNPRFPISCRFGYWGDFVYNRSLITSDHHHEIEDTDILTNALYLVFNFRELFDLFATFGTSRFLIHTNAETFGGISGNRLVLETNSGWSWSVGSRLTFLEYHHTKAGIVGQFFSSAPKVDRITLADTNSIYLDSSDFKYCEWQLGLGISQHLSWFIAYVGVMYEQTHVNLDNILTLIDSIPLHLVNLKSQKKVGFAVGITLLDSEKMHITIEGRFFAEKAVYVNRQIRF